MSELNASESSTFRTMDEALQSDILDHIRTFEGPPASLDLLKASDEELASHGLPRRPDPETEPRLAELWHRGVEMAPEYVPAQLSIDPVLSVRDPLWRRADSSRGFETEGSFGPSGWGGIVAQSDKVRFWDPLTRKVMTFPGGATNTVFGQWTIPGIFPASDPAGDITAGFWVGIDGWNNGQVLQAGVAVTVHVNATVEWWAWTEWYTTTYQDPAVKVDNFPVSVGDTVTVLVCGPTPERGFVVIHNVTTGQVTSIGIPARPGIHLQGQTAEWIVEGISTALPVFLPAVMFTQCSAGTKTSSFDLKPSGFTTEIAGDSPGEQLTHSTIASDSVAIVQWEGFW
jgi:Peptidase A4 family